MRYKFKIVIYKEKSEFHVYISQSWKEKPELWDINAPMWEKVRIVREKVAITVLLHGGKKHKIELWDVNSELWGKKSKLWDGNVGNGLPFHT